MIKDYRREVGEKKRGYLASDKSRLDKIARCADVISTPLYMIHRPEILSLLQWIKTSGTAAPGVKVRPTTEATLKRYYNLIHHIFSVAVEWGKLDKNPCDDLARHEVPKEGKSRDRRLRGKEYQQMLDALAGEARAIFICLIESSMRRGEVLGMEWEHLDLRRRSLSIPETKTDEPRVIPLSTLMVRALQEHKNALRDDDGKIVRMPRGKVFRIGPDALRYQWRAARKAIGSPDLRIHDLRHEAASRLIGDKGLNLIEAAAITGHKSLQMLKRYTHLHHDHILKKLG